MLVSNIYSSNCLSRHEREVVIVFSGVWDLLLVKVCPALSKHVIREEKRWCCKREGKLL